MRWLRPEASFRQPRGKPGASTATFATKSGAALLFSLDIRRRNRAGLPIYSLRLCRLAVYPIEGLSGPNQSPQGQIETHKGRPRGAGARPDGLMNVNQVPSDTLYEDRDRQPEGPTATGRADAGRHKAKTQLCSRSYHLWEPPPDDDNGRYHCPERWCERHLP
jgi:hypothetical protein